MMSLDNSFSLLVRCFAIFSSETDLVIRVSAGSNTTVLVLHLPVAVLKIAV